MTEETHEMEEVFVITATDENGNEVDYQEVERIEVDGKTFSLLVEICEDDDCECGHVHGDVIIARVDKEDGEDVYVEPTDEEFALVDAKLEEMAKEDEVEE